MVELSVYGSHRLQHPLVLPWLRSINLSSLRRKTGKVNRVYFTSFGNDIVCAWFDYWNPSAIRPLVLSADIQNDRPWKTVIRNNKALANELFKWAWYCNCIYSFHIRCCSAKVCTITHSSTSHPSRIRRDMNALYSADGGNNSEWDDCKSFWRCVLETYKINNHSQVKDLLRLDYKVMSSFIAIALVHASFPSAARCS